MEKRERIWELDALRGLFLLCMVVIHFLYDLTDLCGITIREPVVYVLIKQYGGVLFVLISGICVTLGRRSALRGAIVLACGMLVTAVTYGMYAFCFSGPEVCISFGVLHLLGVCMLLWCVLRRLPTPALAALGAAMVVAGYLVVGVHVPQGWLFPLGLTREGYFSADYFPLLPHLGWFLLGAVLGRTAYRARTSLLPRFPRDAAPVRFLRLCGRQSLPIYLLHQPVLYAIAMGIAAILN